MPARLPVGRHISYEGFDMLHVFAVITTKPGQRAAVLSLFHDNLAAVRAEAGCISYDPVIDVPDFGAMQTPLGPDSFGVIERWEDAQALKAHAAAPHMVEYGRLAGPMIASRTIHVLELSTI
jgi:quinol monooxygenase YgiN